MSSKEERIQYITSIRRTVENYCTFPCAKAFVRNQQAAEIEGAMKQLSDWREWEEVADILRQLSEVWEKLPGNGVRYSTWFHMAVNELQPEGACWLFREHRELFLCELYDTGADEGTVSRIVEWMDETWWDDDAEKAPEIKDYKLFVSRNRKKARTMREAADKRYEEQLQEKARAREEAKAARQAAKERREARARERERQKEESAAGKQTDGTSVMVSDETQSALSFLKENGIALPKPFSKELCLLNTRINGSRYVENIDRLAGALRERDSVRLVLEPENPYDERAIRVDTMEGNKLGYIPRRVNEILFNLMNAGKHVYGVVADGDIGTALEKDLPPEQIEIFIDVYMTD
jgi:hypothetical protein